MNDEAFVNEEMAPDCRLNKMTNAIIGAAIEVHRAIVISYLNITKLKLALMINFHVKVLKDGIRRIAH